MGDDVTATQNEVLVHDQRYALINNVVTKTAKPFKTTIMQAKRKPHAQD